MTNVNEVWADTGVVVERDYTPEEAAQRAKDVKAFADQKAQEESDKAAKDADKAALLDKLGITADEAALLLG